MDSGEGVRRIRREVAAALGRKDLPEKVWQRAVKAELHVEYLEWRDDPESHGYLDALVEGVRQILGYYEEDLREGEEKGYRLGYRDGKTEALGARRPKGAGAAPLPSGFRGGLVLTPAEQARVRAVSNLYAIQAAIDPWVQKELEDFRTRWLEGRVLSPEEALRFLRAPMHGAEAPTGELSYIDERGDPASVFFGDGSALADLRALVARLIARYPWQHVDVPLFVLAGTAPEIMPLDACIWPDNRARFGRLVLRITVEPWISPKTLEEFYRGMQQHWVEQKVLPARPKTRGKEGAARSWEVLAFHTARWYAAGQPLDDHALLAEWNATCPDAAYTTGDRPVRQLQQALHRAWDSVLYWKRKYGETAAPD